MAPPTHDQIQSIIEKKLSPDQVKSLIADFVKDLSDLDILSNFLLAANVTYQQLLAVINGQYDIKQTVTKEKDGSEKKSISINFDLSGIPETTFDKTKNEYGDGVLKKILEAKDGALRKRLLKGIVPDADLDEICKLIEQKKSITDLGALEAVLAHEYTLSKGALTFKKPLDLIRDPKTRKIDEEQLTLIQNKGYTPHQLVRLFNNQFNVGEIKALFSSSQIGLDQLKGLLNGKYEVHRQELDGGKGQLIELRFRPESYKQYLEDILAGRVPLENVLQLFSNRYGPEELSAILALNLTAPQLHALITGDYVVERVDNPDGSYSLNITYKKGAGDVTEIEAPPDAPAQPEEPVQKDSSAAPKPAATQPIKQEVEPTPKASKAAKEEPLVAPGTASRAKDRFLHPEQVPIEKTKLEEPQKVKIPDFSNEKEWAIEKSSKLKIPAMFASAAKPNFHAKAVKHLGKDQIKGFYDLDKKKH